MSRNIEKSFEGEDWETKPIPVQPFPYEVLKLLEALNATRAKGWLSAESHIRNLGEQARKNLGKMLSDIGKTLAHYPTRYFTIYGDGQPLFVWMQRAKEEIQWKKFSDKASAAAICTKSPDIVGLVVEVNANGTYEKAHRYAVHVPANQTFENHHIYEDAELMSQPNRTVDINKAPAFQKAKVSAKIGRNQTCPCGSGVKYKRCHGR